jgi:hypothetical protein
MSGNILCRSVESSAHNPGFRGGKINIRRARAAPGTATGFENLWFLLDKFTLLLRCELYHAPAFVRGTKRRENFFGDAEIGMIHVRTLDSLGNFQRHLSKLLGSHPIRDRYLTNRDKPRLALKSNTAGVRKREDANRTREAGHLDEIQDAVANTLNLYRNGAVGFNDWLDHWLANTT